MKEFVASSVLFLLSVPAYFLLRWLPGMCLRYSMSPAVDILRGAGLDSDTAHAFVAAIVAIVVALCANGFRVVEGGPFFF